MPMVRRTQRSIRSPDNELVHVVRENAGIGNGGYLSWCDRAYFSARFLVDEVPTCLWCAAQRQLSWTNPCAEIPL